MIPFAILEVANKVSAGATFDDTFDHFPDNERNGTMAMAMAKAIEGRVRQSVKNGWMTKKRGCDWTGAVTRGKRSTRRTES